MSKPHTDLQTNKTTLAKYLLGDLVIVLLWAILISFSVSLSITTSPYLLPLWIYVGLCVMAVLIPKVKPGSYDLSSAQTSLWFISFQFSRIWGYPPFKHLIFSTAITRTLFLTCAGAKVSMNVGWSSISTLSDPSMIEVESEVIVGVESLISGHMIIGGKLILQKIILKKGCLISARCAIAPGCTVGEGAILQGAVDLLPGVVIPKGAVIGKGSTVTSGMSLEENKTYPWFMRPPEKIKH